MCAPQKEGSALTIRHRPMEPRDVRACMEVISAHPVASARYGRWLADLAEVWRRLLESEGFAAAAIVEEEVSGKIRIPAIGTSVFVTDDFLRELKTPPHFWFGPELVKRVRKGKSPLLSPKQVETANSREGLNLLVWYGCVRIEDGRRAEVGSELATAFVAYHRGFNLRELMVQVESPEHYQAVRNQGGYLWNHKKQCFDEFCEADPDEIIRKPHVFGLTRELALKQPCMWTGSLFVLYRAPQFGFSRSEQRLLLSAFDGGTDLELADRLGISLDTVRKEWRAIYDRVAACSPDLIPDHAAMDREDGGTSRGKAKKQILLAYLREHPEELRPISRRLLEQMATARSHRSRAK